jgi:hypothetical protein
VKRSAIAGNLDAMKAVANLYEFGQGVERDLAKSASWRLQAARAGDAASMHDYGLMAYRGRGVEVDLIEAYRWLTLADHFGWPSLERDEVARKVSSFWRTAIDDEVKTWRPEPARPPLLDSF